MTCENLDQALQAPAQVTSLRLTRQSLDSIARIPWQRFTNLRSLDLNNNAIVRLPKGLWSLTGLQRLFLAGNRILRLPEEIKQLTQLKQLYLEGNRLRELPPLPTGLEVINLSRNKLQAFPESILECTQTRNLYLSANPIRELPQGIAQLSQLRILQVSACRLTELPALPTELSQLDLSRNKLTQLPPNWEELTRLESLQLSENQLKLDETAFRHQPQLRFLHLERTSSQLEPAALLAFCPRLEDVRGAINSHPRSERIQRFIMDQASVGPHFSRELLWDLWQGNAPALSLEDALELGGRSQPLFFRIGAARVLLSNYRESLRQLTRSRWQLIGSFFSDLEVLRERLERQGVSLVGDSPDACILGYNWPAELSLRKDQKILDERSVLRWLDAREGRSLTHSTDEDAIVSMEKLIWGHRSEGIGEWLRFLEQNGMPDSTLRRLLRHWLKERPEHREHIHRVVAPYLPLPVQLAWEAIQSDAYALQLLPPTRSRSLSERLLRALVI